MKIGEQIDRYLILEKIGEGGMGCVLKVRNIENGEIYALKYCKETDDKSKRRFKREISAISDTIHPNIVKLLDLNTENEPPYFVMPLAKGSVHDIINDIKGDFSQVCSIFESMCKGITALHNAKNYHRDIKPRNVLLMEDGSIVVTDFGLVKIIDRDSSSHSSSNNFLGTIGYHAPEQLEAKNSDHRTDVFQLGKSFYEMYTGNYPYLINPAKLPAGLVYIIQRATHPDREKRFQSVSELLQAINSFKKSMNPKENPRDALETKMLEIHKLLEEGYYREELCIELLDILGNNVDDYELFLEYFDKLPDSIIKILSNQLEERFEPILDAYTENLERFLKETHYDFSYAEVVAGKMTSVFVSTDNIHFKGIAIKNVLIAAVYCNRFNAMDSFNSLLRKVSGDEEAGLIAQILREEIEAYKNIADQTADNYLHPVIIEVKKEALERIEEEEIQRRKEQEEMVNKYLR